jgi:hypothetical protein
VLLRQLVDQRVDLIGAQHVRIIEAIGQLDGGDAAAVDERIDPEGAIGVELADGIEHDRHGPPARQVGVDERHRTAGALERPSGLERERGGSRAPLRIDDDDD